MPKTLLLSAIALLSLTFMSQKPAHACEECDKAKLENQQEHALHIGTSRASSHAPIGVMGDHMHHKGEWMLAYRYMNMRMEGLRDGTNSLSPQEIVTSVPNRFFGAPMQPPTLRVVPTKMTMDMHMFGGMYAPTEWLTVMASVPYIEKNMDATTFAGPVGTTVLGQFSTRSQGWGDTKLTSLWRLYDDSVNHAHFNLGFSVPTGSIKQEDTILTPMGMRPRVRLPYGMQLGSGTYDILPGVTYTGHKNRVGWGAQYRAELRLEDENDQGYRLGDKHYVTAWGSYDWANWISTSLRLTGTQQAKIHGIDPNIVGPTQAADPDNYGGRTIEAGFGVNLMATEGAIKGHRLAFEIATPVYQDLNGPQLERDTTATVGWQYAF